MPKKMYELWPKLEARLPKEKYDKLQDFYHTCISQAPGVRMTPDDLGKYSWHEVLTTLAYYEEHGRPLWPARDSALIAIYRAFHGEEE